ncbi:MAG: bifunctional oligoribonuclease/PAP phosphatase NrnA [Planctomycetaceae bacterium]|nr:bifunctional oligoribonuclease/PAP phosphatase NrnA [Planctomycetaceae bacterium]
MPIAWEELLEIVNANQRFVISTHVRPDGDAIGSAMGMAGLLEQLGKDVRIVNPSATPDHLKFLDPEGRIQKIGGVASVEAACDTDVHLIVDTSAWGQLQDIGKVLQQTSAKKVVVDHHVSSDDLGAIEFKDPTAAAAGVLVVEFFRFCERTPSESEATVLFTAIATDTGWFRFPNADARTLRTVAWLIECGAQPSIIYRELYERSSLAKLKLQAVALGRAEVTCDGRLAHTYVKQQDFRDTGSHPADTEDLVNSCLVIQGVEAAFILVEQPDGRIKASLRSRTGLSVAAIAESFGGGGHRQAAGAMLPGPLDSAMSAILLAFGDALGCAPATDE